MLLECCDLTFKYPETDTIVLNKVDCVFSTPGFHAVFGPSGVGKSSFAKLVSIGGRQAYQGQMKLTGLDTILYSYNLERLPGWASAGSHLGKVVAPEKEALKNELIEIFDIDTFLDSRFHQLSMGQQNRVNLIRYLLQDFNLLILDESLANVDEKLRETIILAMKRIFHDRMFLYISHNLMEVSTFCDQILVFGASATCKSYVMVEGQNCTEEKDINKVRRDATMLEIMNAF